MLRILCCLVALTSIGACAACAGQTNASVPQSPPVPDLLRPGDAIRLSIWREPDLSGDFTIDETGAVTFPKIGTYKVGNESPESLKGKVVRAYQVYLVNPSIDIVILRRVNILGAVQKPGLYPIDATMTIADALAVAGGVTPLGDADNIEVMRGGERLRAKLSQRTRITESAIRSGDQLYVPERSWLSRNTAMVAALITASVSLAVTLAR